MTLGRLANLVAAVALIGGISADILIGRCDLPSGARAVAAGTSVVAASAGSQDTDPCASGCLPDCYGCSRSEVAGAVQAVSQPEVQAATALPGSARPSDGVLVPPYHPPLPLL